MAFSFEVMYACGLLAGTDRAFRIGGFGQDDWGFDVGYDMSVAREAGVSRSTGENDL